MVVKYLKDEVENDLPSSIMEYLKRAKNIIRKAESGGYDFCIEIVINGKSNYSPNFKKQEVLEKQIEYYKYYYDKYNKNTK